MSAGTVPRDVTAYGMGLAAPLTLFFLLFFVAPLVQLLVLSLHNEATAGVVWGIGQYVQFLTDPFSLGVLGSTLAARRGSDRPVPGARLPDRVALSPCRVAQRRR